jgi:hypothetical protein
MSPVFLAYIGQSLKNKKIFQDKQRGASSFERIGGRKPQIKNIYAEILLEILIDVHSKSFKAVPV